VTGQPVADLNDFAGALKGGGYNVVQHDLAGQSVLLAESPYALLAVLPVSDCIGLRDKVEDVQAALTRLAAEAPSARSWDLYLLVHMCEPVTDPVDALLLEEIEADTRYVRKFVRVQIDPAEENAMDRALRPLLPLRPSPRFDLTAPLDELRSELYALDAPRDLVDEAIASFEQRTTVEIA
jgi:hypothetical protein